MDREKFLFRLRILSAIIIAFGSSFVIMGVLVDKNYLAKTIRKLTTIRQPTLTPTIIYRQPSPMIFLTNIPPTPSLFPTVTPTVVGPTQTIIQIPTKTPTPFPSVTKKPTLTQKPTSTPKPTPTPSLIEREIAKYTIPYISGYTGTPTTSRQIFDFGGTRNYSIPYRNPNCSLTQTDISRAYERMKSYYPSYWQNTKLLTQWKTVQNYSIKYNFNPTFVISLWLEESAAGGASRATPFGCDYLRNPDGTYTTLKGNDTSVEKQLLCIFVTYAADPRSFVKFACSWQFGSASFNNSTQTCSDIPNFPKSLNFWFTLLSQNQSEVCKTKYCPNAPGC